MSGEGFQPGIAAEAPKTGLRELGSVLDRFVNQNSRDCDPAVRVIVKLAREIREPVEIVATERKRPPELQAKIDALRLEELADRRRELSKEIDALDAEERRIRFEQAKAG